MATYYTVVQYLPNPVIDERINIGVIVFGDDSIRTRFVSDWTRVHQFGGENINFLKKFANSVEHAELVPELNLNGLPKLNQEGLKKIAGKWINSIQFTPPHASLKKPDELLESVAARFLRTTETGVKEYRDRRAAIRLAHDSIEAALVKKIGAMAQKMVREEYPIRGKLDDHRFDIGVANGQVLFAANALSFEVPEGKRLQKDVDAIAWAIDDVRKQESNLPLAVVMLPPKHESEMFARTENLFRKLEADVVLEDELESWAQKQAAPH